MTKNSLLLQIKNYKGSKLEFKISNFYSRVLPKETISKRKGSNMNIIIKKEKKEEWPCLEKFQIVSVLNSVKVTYYNHSLPKKL